MIVEVKVSTAIFYSQNHVINLLLAMLAQDLSDKSHDLYVLVRPTKGHSLMFGRENSWQCELQS